MLGKRYIEQTKSLKNVHTLTILTQCRPGHEGKGIVNVFLPGLLSKDLERFKNYLHQKLVFHYFLFLIGDNLILELFFLNFAFENLSTSRI